MASHSSCYRRFCHHHHHNYRRKQALTASRSEAKSDQIKPHTPSLPTRAKNDEQNETSKTLAHKKVLISKKPNCLD